MTIYILALLAFLTHVGFAGSKLAVPLYAIDQGSSPFVVGTVMALYAVFPAVLALPAGRMTDRLGFKIPLLFGTGSLFIGLMLSFMWPSTAMLCFTASLLGLSFMACQLVTQTLAGAIAGPADRGRNFALLSLGFALANFSGPLLAGVMIDHFGHARAFLALAMPLIPAVALAAFGSRWIPGVHAKSDAIRGGVFELLKIRALRNTMIASGIVSSAWDVYQFVMPIYGRSLGLSATAIGVVLGAFSLAIIAVRLVLPFALRRKSEAQLLTYAMFVAAAAYCLFPLTQGAWTLGAVSFLLGMGCGCGQPLSMTLVFNASPPGRAGEATGMRITVNQITHMVMPLLFGAVGSVAGFATVFLTNAGCMAMGGYLSLRSIAKR